MPPPIRVKAEARVIAPLAEARLIRTWTADSGEPGAGVTIGISHAWAVLDCPFCRGFHLHDAEPIQGDPRIQLRVVRAGCDKPATSRDTSRQSQWDRYELCEIDPDNTDSICAEDAQALQGLVCSKDGEPAPPGQEVICLIY